MCSESFEEGIIQREGRQREREREREREQDVTSISEGVVRRVRLNQGQKVLKMYTNVLSISIQNVFNFAVHIVKTNIFQTTFLFCLK